MPSYLFKIQLYYILSQYFDSYILINETKDLYINIIYKKLKTKTDIFTKLFEEYKKYDSSLGKKYLANYDINFDLSINVDKKFMSFFDNFKKNKKKY